MFDSPQRYKRLRALLISALVALAISSVGPEAGAQQPAQDQQADAPNATTTAPAATEAVSTPPHSEYKGVRLGMGADEIRQKLGKPEEGSKEQDFFVFSEVERARVYYDDAQKATAIITTFIGKKSNAPTPEQVLGTTIEANPDGSLYKLVQYPEAGYWVAYSRTAGDEPLTIITIKAVSAEAK